MLPRHALIVLPRHALICDARPPAPPAAATPLGAWQRELWCRHSEEAAARRASADDSVSPFLSRSMINVSLSMLLCR